MGFWWVSRGTEILAIEIGNKVVLRLGETVGKHVMGLTCIGIINLT